MNNAETNLNQNDSLNPHLIQQNQHPSKTLKHVLLLIAILLFYVMFDVLPSRRSAFLIKKEGYTLEMTQLLHDIETNLTIKRQTIKTMQISLREHQLQMKREEDLLRSKQSALERKETNQHDKQLDIQVQQKRLARLQHLNQQKEILIKTKESYLNDLQNYQKQKQIAKALKSTFQKGVTVIINSYTRFDQLNQTLRSFYAHNTLMVSRVIVVQNGPFKEEIGPLMKAYPNLTWLMTPQPKSQVDCIDLAYKYVETQWVLHVDDTWAFIKSGFLEQVIPFLEDHPYTSHFYLLKRKQSDLNAQTFNQTFSFIPSLRRMKYYKLLPKGYAGAILIDHETNGESSLVKFYKGIGLTPAESEEDYITKISGDLSKNSSQI